MDLHSIHFYSSFGERDRSDASEYFRRVFGPEAAERGIRITKSLIDLAVSSSLLVNGSHMEGLVKCIENNVPSSKSIKVAFDEWGVWDETKGLLVSTEGFECHLPNVVL